ncbi:MAG: DUF5777 family beta-barrel protein [bacterium]
MKKIFITIILAMASVTLFAVQYEMPMLDLTVPSGLTNNQMYFNFGHKMMQALNKYPTDNVFALLKNGASLNLNLRYMVGAGFEFKAGYDTIADEKNIAVSWVQKIPSIYLNAQVDLQFFGYTDAERTQTAINFFYLLSLQTVPFLDERVTVAVDLGYDGYLQKQAMGLGVSILTLKDITLVGEYYPVFEAEADEDITATEKVACYSFGIRYATYGHQFMLKFGNSTQMETRQLMQGTTANNLYFGISIMRFIDFNNPEE